MVFSKHHPKKADAPSCLSDASFAHFLSNIFPSLRHFTFSLQSWFKVSFSVKHSFNTGCVFEAWIRNLWNGHGVLTQAGVLFLCRLLGHERADELGLLVPSYRSCLVDYSHFFFQLNRTWKTSELFL